MPLDTQTCPKCSEPLIIQKEWKISDTKTILKTQCSHLIDASEIKCSQPEQIVSLDSKHLYPFQNDGVRFGLNARDIFGSIRILIADEMGLGKTLQAIGTVMLADTWPVLAIVKSALKTQWQKEFMRWGGEDVLAQVIDSPKDFPIPGLKAYIMSYDILRRFAKTRKSKADVGVRNSADFEDDESFNYINGTSIETDKSKEKGELFQFIEKLGIKTIILDECQQIKNTESQRTIFTRAICKHVENVIALSGTPIKNNAGEYFPILNILHPEIPSFKRYSDFMKNDVDSYFNGYQYKFGGLINPDAFKEKTKDFIIRRTVKEVLPDLPSIRRVFQFHELSKEVEKLYIETFKQFRDEFNKGGEDSVDFAQEGNLMGLMSKLRHLVGISLINPVIDYVMEVMGSTDDRLCIFVHHIDVAEKLAERLNSLFSELNIPPCARHVAGTSALDTEKNFEKTRVLIASTLAGGEGLNLQKLCFRFVMMERQWNPANEEQAERRFPRPEGLKVESIEGVYFTAVGTINEMFAEIVERKREIVSKTLDGKAVAWDQSSLMKELASTLASTGGRRWSI